MTDIRRFSLRSPLFRSLALIAAPALTAAFLAAGPAAADWAVFRGDAALTGTADDPLPANLQPAWTFEAGAGIESTAAVVDGVVYVGSLDENLYALDLATGKERFRFQAKGEVKSSPSVRDGVVYFGDEGGFFHAVDAKTGKALWSFETDGGVTSSASFFPRGSDGGKDGKGGTGVLFGSYDGFLYALDAKTGEELWELETDGYVHATPAIADGRTYVAGCDTYFRAVSLADGSEVGKVSLEGYAAASPAILGDRAYVGTFENQFHAVDLKAMKLAWTFEDPERKFPFYASAAASSKAVVIGGRDKMVRALDPKTGKELWSHATRARVDASPVIAGDRVIAGSKSGVLYVLGLADGKVLWEFDTGSALIASPAVADGHLVIGTEDGLLYAFRGK